MSTVLALRRAGEIKTITLFMIILTALLLDTWFTQNHIMTRQVYYNLLSDQLEIYRIDMIYGWVKKFSVWNYLLVPLITLVRILFIALLIQLPLVFRFIDVPFSRLFRIATIAFLPLMLMTLIKTAWLAMVPGNQIDAGILSRVPLALTNLLDTSAYPRPVLGFLSSFNLFEITWCCVIVILLSKAARLKKSDTALMVFFIWTLILCFRFVLVLYLEKVNS
ncbi:hypothetical protein GF407_16155 [candidate division KSB1 bacterium]|nr:hypothetical protein [candidate division KSB1 bacterium]